MPQSPQLFMSDETSTQPPPHIFWLEEQLMLPPLPLPAVPFDPPDPAEPGVVVAGWLEVQATNRPARQTYPSQALCLFMSIS